MPAIVRPGVPAHASQFTEPPASLSLLAHNRRCARATGLQQTAPRWAQTTVRVAVLRGGNVSPARLCAQARLRRSSAGMELQGAFLLSSCPHACCPSPCPAFTAPTGIGVCAALALLELPPSETLPPLECLFTIDEETGLTGGQLRMGLAGGRWWTGHYPRAAVMAGVPGCRSSRGTASRVVLLPQLVSAGQIVAGLGPAAHWTATHLARPCIHSCPVSFPSGAFNLDGGMLRGRTLLNLDTEDWGDVFIGCAGGRVVL